MQLHASTGQCASLFPGDFKGTEPWLLKVPLSGSLSIGCMVNACPGKVRWDPIVAQALGCYDCLSGEARLPEHGLQLVLLAHILEGLFDPFSRCEVEVQRVPPPLISACRVMTWPSLSGNSSPCSCPASFFLGIPTAWLPWSDLQKQRNSFCFRA